MIPFLQLFFSDRSVRFCIIFWCNIDWTCMNSVRIPMYTINMHVLHLSAKSLLLLFSTVFPAFAEVIPTDSQLYMLLCCSCYGQNSLPALSQRTRHISTEDIADSFSLKASWKRLEKIVFKFYQRDWEISLKINTGILLKHCNILD